MLGLNKQDFVERIDAKHESTGRLACETLDTVHEMNAAASSNVIALTHVYLSPACFWTPHS